MNGTPSPYSLEGKLVLVTGAGTGIGRGVALELARQGADVALHYASSAKGAQEALEQIQAMGRRGIAIQGDLGVVAECRRVVDEAAAYLGGLDALVSNSGVTLTLGFFEVTEDHYNWIYNLNARGEFFCTQQAAKHILDRGEALRRQFPDRPWAGGSIVTVSSVHGLVGMPCHSVYAGTKGAINAFTRELAVELAPLHIRLNAVAPGTIEVPSYWKKNPDYTREAGNRTVPWGRVGQPQDVGYLTAYLISDAAEFMTGQVLYFDGGLTAKMALEGQPCPG